MLAKGGFWNLEFFLGSFFSSPGGGNSLNAYLRGTGFVCVYVCVRFFLFNILVFPPRSDFEFGYGIRVRSEGTLEETALAGNFSCADNCENDASLMFERNWGTL